MTQRLQVAIRQRIVARLPETDAPLAVPFALRLVQWRSVLPRIPARLVGPGFRPGHIRVPEQPPSA